MAPESSINLNTLPPEILLQIHCAAKNPALSLVSTSIHAFLSEPYVTPSYVAKYLLDLYSSNRADAILVKALRHPVCTVTVAESIQRIWDVRRGYIPPKLVGEGNQEDKGKRKDEQSDSSADTRDRSSSSPPPRRPTKPAITVPELPRRLFRHLTTQSSIPPLLEYLFNTYPTISPNSHNGYPLSRAVLCQNRNVIAYLLSRGADPGLRDGLAVEIAVKMGNIKLVRLLVDNPQGKVVDITSRFVELAVKSGSDAIVQYFVHDKGVMPPLHSIMQMGTVPKKRKHEIAKTNNDRPKRHEDRPKKRKTSTKSELKPINSPVGKKPSKRSRPNDKSSRSIS